MKRYKSITDNTSLNDFTISINTTCSHHSIHSFTLALFQFVDYLPNRHKSTVSQNLKPTLTTAQTGIQPTTLYPGNHQLYSQHPLVKSAIRYAVRTLQANNHGVAASHSIALHCIVLPLAWAWACGRYLM